MILTELSVRRPVFATVLSLVLLMLGIMAALRLSVREFPNIETPQVSVAINYRGASAEVIETKITRPIEDRLSGIEGLEKLTSSSEDERSRISLEFNLNKDIEAAANDVRDRISRIQSTLPPEADPPQISKVDARAGDVVLISMTTTARSVGELTDYVNRYVVNRLSVVPGVGIVSTFGDQTPAMRVWLDRRALAARQLTVQDVEGALRNENIELPAGRIESVDREFTLRTDTGMRTEEDFRHLVIGRGTDGYLVRLSDVAEVRKGVANPRSAFHAGGKTAIGVSVIPTSTANVLDVAKGTNEVVQQLQASLPPDISMSIATDNSIFVRESIREVVRTMVIALALVLVVIFSFLGTVRATLIPFITIPVAMVSACTVMAALGFSLNLLTLLGAVLAIGLVVDDAIVVMENIVRRIELGEPPLLAAVDGSREIAFAVLATTAVLIAVFLPISFIPGNIGRLFGEFGVSVVAAIFFSCVVALSLTPMLASKLFAGGIVRNRFSIWVDGLFRRLADIYRRALVRVVRHAGVVAVVALLLSGASYYLFTTLPSEYTPVEDRNQLFVVLNAPEGSSLQYTNQYTEMVAKIVSREVSPDQMVLVIDRVGGTTGGGGTAGVNNGRVVLRVVPLGGVRKERTQQMATRLRARLAGLAGVRVAIVLPGGLAGRNSGVPVQFVLGGSTYEELARWRDIVIEHARQNPGFINLDSDYDPRKPRVKVEVDRARAADLGVSLDTVGRTLETMLGARQVTTYVERGEEYNVMLQARAEDRATPTDLDNIYVRQARGGGLVPLSNLVKLHEEASASELHRFNRLRSVTISAGLAEGYTLGEALKFLEGVVHTQLPPEAQIDYDGQSREYRNSSGALYSTFLLAIIIVYLVLAAQFESFRHPAVIITTVPLAVAGAVAGLWWLGGSINLFSQIGAVMLVGLAAKNGILIVEFANQLRDRGMEFLDAIVESAVVRLRPVLMTSLCSVFGALPLLLGTGAGSETRRPIGAVIVFGVTISLFLTLLVVPAAYVLIARGSHSPQYVSRLISRLRDRNAAPPAETANPPP
jgi:multidrug efflux pump